jgi:putative transposase
VIVTDKLKRYGASKREVLPNAEHQLYRYLNNRAENFRQPTRRRQRHIQGCKLLGCAQRFLAAYGPIAPHFRPRRYLLPAPNTLKRWEKTRYLGGNHVPPPVIQEL